MTPARRWLGVAGIPFGLSLVLSLSTVGAHAFWQDSGFYLVALKEMSVLYPPGFVLYQGLCWAWTRLLFFVDFTLAVHLFSSLCAALAAGTLALAARDLLKARGRLFTTGSGRDEALSDWAATAAGCLAACGFTFWFTGIYAKGYSLYYFILALLLWSLLRADETGKPRHFTAVALLIGLAWAGHPSSALLAPVLLAYVFLHFRSIGLRGLAWRALAAAGVALGPAVFLPFLADRSPLVSMGDPSDPGELSAYLLGSNFTTLPGAFGWEPSRVASFGQYLWEEFLGVGLGLVTAGLLVISRTNRRLLSGLLLWVVPFAGGTIAFKVEGQHDCWFVAAWMPLYLVAAVGLSDLAGRLATKGRVFVAGAGAVAVAWAAGINAPLLQQRTYDLAEIYGRLHLDALDPGSILLVSGDDALALTSYLQTVRGVRQDIVLVNLPRLAAVNSSHGRWYLKRLLAAYPFLRAPEETVPSGEDVKRRVTAFLNANIDCGRPLFSTVAPAPQGLREEVSAIPAGPLWKAVHRGSGSLEAAYWNAPITPEEVRRRFRRERGQEISYPAGRVHVVPEAYEQRLFKLLLAARYNLAMAQMKLGNFAKALEIYQWAIQVNPELKENPGFLYSLGRAYYGLGDRPHAKACFSGVLDRSAEPLQVVESHRFLGKIAREEGLREAARQEFRRALEVPGIDPRLAREIEEEAGRP